MFEFCYKRVSSKETTAVLTVKAGRSDIWCVVEGFVDRLSVTSGCCRFGDRLFCRFNGDDSFFVTSGCCRFGDRLLCRFSGDDRLF